MIDCPIIGAGSPSASWCGFGPGEGRLLRAATGPLLRQAHPDTRDVLGVCHHVDAPAQLRGESLDAVEAAARVSS